MEGALDLPLQPVGDHDVAKWVYSSETYERITTMHQMRVIFVVIVKQPVAY